MKNQDLVWARESAGLSQGEAAEKIGVTRVTFARWENGSTQIPPAKYNAFLAAVGVSLAQVSAALKALPPRPTAPEALEPPKPDPMAAVRSNAEVWLTDTDGRRVPTYVIRQRDEMEAAIAANGGFDPDGTCPSLGGKIWYTVLPPGGLKSWCRFARNHAAAVEQVAHQKALAQDLDDLI